MLGAHPNKSTLFDIKQDRGGIIDVEFIVQYLVLGYANKHVELTGNIGNIALLKLAGELGLISSHNAEKVRTAYREFRHIQHLERLNSDSDLAGIVPTEGQTQEQILIETSGYLNEHRLAVIALWDEVFSN